jgi:hypothetical protein
LKTDVRTRDVSNAKGEIITIHEGDVKEGLLVSNSPSQIKLRQRSWSISLHRISI